MSIQKKIVYVVVIILAVIGLLSLLPAPGGDTLNESDALYKTQLDDGGLAEQGAVTPSAGGGGGGYNSAWDWARPHRQPKTTATRHEPKVERWSSPSGWCAWGGSVCW